MTESSEAPSLGDPLDVVPDDQTLVDATAGDATRPAGEVNAFTDQEGGELVTEQEQSIDTPDELGGVGGGQSGGAG